MKLSPRNLILLTRASVLIGLFTTSPTLGGTYGLINLKVQLFDGRRNAHRLVHSTLVAVAVVWFLCWRIGYRLQTAAQRDPGRRAAVLSSARTCSGPGRRLGSRRPWPDSPRC
jgi:hypothetical protein